MQLSGIEKIPTCVMWNNFVMDLGTSKNPCWQAPKHNEGKEREE